MVWKIERYMLSFFRKKDQNYQTKTSPYQTSANQNQSMYPSYSTPTPSPAPTPTPTKTTTTQNQSMYPYKTTTTKTAPYAYRNNYDGSVGYSDGSSAPMSRPTQKVQQTQTPILDKQVAQPTQQSGSDAFNNAYANYLAKIQGISQKQTDFERSEADRKAAYLRESNAIQQGAIKAQIPELQNNFNTFKQNTLDSITDAEKQTAMEQENIRTAHGEALRRSAQTGRESQASLKQLFANLGTVDSLEFAKQIAKETGKLDARQAETLQSQAQALTQTEIALGQYRRESQSLIQQEEQKLNTQLAQINAQLAQGTIEHENAVKEAYALAEQNIMGIQQNLANMEYQGEQQRLEYYANLESTLNQATAGLELSDEFLQTGNPVTREDYIYQLISKEEGSSNVKLTEKQRAYDSAAQIANNLIPMINEQTTGIGKGIQSSVGKIFGGSPEGLTEYRAGLAAARTAVRNALLGANMSEQEMKSLMDLIPQGNETPDEARRLLNSFVQNVRILANSGESYASQNSAVVENDPLGIL